MTNRDAFTLLFGMLLAFGLEALAQMVSSWMRQRAIDRQAAQAERAASHRIAMALEREHREWGSE